jgi:hypothetical protein
VATHDAAMHSVMNMLYLPQSKTSHSDVRFFSAIGTHSEAADL